MSAEHRRYTEAEVNRILRLSVTQSTLPADSEGMTLDEIAAVAAEVGIDAKAVRLAAEKLASDSPTISKERLLGSRPYTEMERVVDGESNDENWDNVVAEIRSAFEGPTGNTTRLGKTWEWYGGGELTATQMSLTPENGRTRVKVRLTAWAVPIFSYGFATIAAWLVITVLLAATFKRNPSAGPAATVFSLGLFITAILLTRMWIGSWYGKRTRQMRSALDRVQKVLSRHSGENIVSTGVQVEVEDGPLVDQMS